MSDGVFIAVCAACLALGLAVGRRWFMIGAVAIWILGVSIAALAGAFVATDEDNSLGVFLFTGLPTLLWVFCAVVGVITRRVMRHS